MSNKGVMPAFVAYGAAIVLIGAAMLLIFVFSFHNNMEITISDKIADGITSINYFYLTEKNINEFAQIVTGITAKESGEQCGGVDCYAWTAGYPTYNDLRNKFEETLRGKITGFPTQIGNGGKISFAPPRISDLQMDESQVKISLFPQQVYRKTDSFLVNASSEKKSEISTQTRYLLLARIGQRLYGNGTYARDWDKIYVNSGKFDCGGDGKADKIISARTQLSSRTDLAGCKILEINFDVDDPSWNSYKTNCYNIANSADPGVNAGKVEGGKIYVQIDSLLEKSLICGISGATVETDGLASVSGSYGEVSKSSAIESEARCVESEAGADAWQKAGTEGKINAILKVLSSSIETGLSGIDVQASAKIGTEMPYGAANYQWCGRSTCTSGGYSVPCQTYEDSSDRCQISPADHPSSTEVFCGSGNGGSGADCAGGCGSWYGVNTCNAGDICGSNGGAYGGGKCCPADYPVFYPYTNLCFSSSEEILKIEKISKVPPPGSKGACDSCTEWNNPPSGQSAVGSPSCSWSNSNSGGFCGWTSVYSCTYAGDQNSGSATTSGDYWWGGASACGNQHKTMSRQQNWGDSIFSQTRTDYSRSWKGDSDSSSTIYSCYLAAYFKFTFTPDISFKIIDTAGDKIVEKGTTNFENLYFAVKFKPAAPYVIGDPDYAPSIEYTCAKTAGQTCETSCSASGKASGSGTCESGKVCCKNASGGESKIVISGEGKDIII